MKRLSYLLLVIPLLVAVSGLMRLHGYSYPYSDYYPSTSSGWTSYSLSNTYPYNFYLRPGGPGGIMRGMHPLGFPKARRSVGAMWTESRPTRFQRPVSARRPSTVTSTCSAPPRPTTLTASAFWDTRSIAMATFWG